MTDVMDRPAIDVRTRFSQILAARKTGKQLIDLLDQLRASKKFTEAEKPVCFGMLVPEAAKRVAAHEALALLAAVRRSEALDKVRDVYDEDGAERIAAALVHRVMTSAPLARTPLVTSIDALIKSKVARDKGQVFSLAVLAGISPDTLDVMCDLTWN